MKNTQLASPRYMLSAMRADLHTHTTASDGALSPTELLRQAESAGVNMLAITDHDTVAGVASLPTDTGAACQVIPGIEFSTQWRKTGIHVLGLNIDPQNASLVDGINRQQDARARRATIIAERLTKHGLQDTLEGAARLAGDAPIGRPHFAQYLVDSDQIDTLQKAYKKYLGPGKPGDVRNLWAELGTVITWIHAAGGQAVLAHPGKYRLTHAKLAELTNDFREAGGDALEVVSGRQDASLTSRLAKLAGRYGLRSSCGSDFHQPGQTWAALGEVAVLPQVCQPVWDCWP